MDLFLILKLHFQKARRVRLAVLIDLQEAEGAFSTRELGPDVIFLPVSKAAWLAPTDSQGGRDFVREMMARTSWAYCQCFARALHVWSGLIEVNWEASVKQLRAQLQPFHGGNPRTGSYEPKLVQGSIASLLWTAFSCG
ncbi:unnamed protein product [Durusdinium trenchii]|uniref:Uncharacterized protein n=1 Tax=Durusdinium trenchii TaxID=1381693 RepID=A0ABP0NDU6_9DINO